MKDLKTRKETRAELKIYLGKLKAFLPKGYVTMIVENLKERGIDIKPGVVYATLDPKRPTNYNEDVAEEAIKIAGEGKEKELLEKAKAIVDS